MASGNSSNANRYKGEDIDTDGDGSVDDAQTLQGNKPNDLGNAIDGESITKNDNNEIQVKKPSNRTASAFTNSKEGFSSVNNTDGSISTNSNQLFVESGSSTVSDKQDAKKSFNNIQTDKIEIPYEFEVAPSESTSDNGQIELFVNGTQVLKEENLNSFVVTRTGTVTVTNQNLGSVKIVSEAGQRDTFNGPFETDSVAKIDEIRVGSTGKNQILIGDAGT
jgi:hypothetical protein